MATDRPSYPSDAAEKFIVRFPPGVREQIAEAAKANNRSMNAEILERLRSPSDEQLDRLYRALDIQSTVLRTLGQLIDALASKTPPKDEKAAAFFALIASMGAAFDREDIPTALALYQQVVDESNKRVRADKSPPTPKP